MFGVGLHGSKIWLGFAWFYNLAWAGVGPKFGVKLKLYVGHNQCFCEIEKIGNQ